MRISTLMSVVGATALIFGGLTLRAQDNPNQAAARAALMNKLKEASAQTAPAATQTMAPANPPAKKPVPAPAATQAVPAPVQTAAMPAPAGGSDTPAQAAARAALMQKMNELNAQQPPPANPSLAPIVMKPSGTAAEPPQPAAQPAKPIPAPVTAVAPASKPKPVTASVPPADDSGFFTPVPPPSNPPVQAGTLPAAANAAPAPTKPSIPLATHPVIPPPTQPVIAPPVVPVAKPAQPPAGANYIGKSLGFQPIEAPPAPVSAQKQAALQSLLARYMANQISPEEYQKERAAILAGP